MTKLQRKLLYYCGFGVCKRKLRADLKQLHSIKERDSVLIGLNKKKIQQFVKSSGESKEHEVLILVQKPEIV